MSLRPKVSIIVPVYNSDKYLSKCLDTLVNQTYENLEIICINDGSTDNSLEILEKFCLKDTRIKLFSQDNSGASVARNEGVKAATGDYVSFIDADDWVYLTLYQTFVEAINNAGKLIDIWSFNVSAYIEGANDVIPKVFFEASDWDNHVNENTIHVFDDCRRPFFRNLSAANKIYRKEFLTKNKIVFPEGLKYEDQYFSLRAFLNAESIMFTDDVFYRYRNEHSSSISIVVSEKVFDIFKVIDLIEDEIMRLNVYESYKYALFQYKYGLFVQNYYLCPENLKGQYYNEMKTRLLAAEKHDLNPNIYRQLSNYMIFEVIKNNDKYGFENFMKNISKR